MALEAPLHECHLLDCSTFLEVGPHSFRCFFNTLSTWENETKLTFSLFLNGTVLSDAVLLCRLKWSAPTWDVIICHATLLLLRVNGGNYTVNVVQCNVILVTLPNQLDDRVFILVVDHWQTDVSLGSLCHGRLEDGIKCCGFSDVNDNWGCMWLSPAWNIIQNWWWDILSPMTSRSLSHMNNQIFIL